MFLPASSVSLAAFLLLCALIVTAFFAGLIHSARREALPAGRRVAVFAAVLAIWLGVISLAVASGWIAARPMPRLMFFFAFTVLAALAAGCSRTGTHFVNLPLPLLVAFQSFRLPLEIILHHWADTGTIPEAMTWTGANFDIITGIVALVLTPLTLRWPAAAWIANVTGIVLLLNVARVAILSSPLPFAWEVTPPLQLAFHLPYALILPVCVGGAAFGHAVLTRALLTAKRQQ
jgi:hypothetical protein